MKQIMFFTSIIIAIFISNTCNAQRYVSEEKFFVEMLGDAAKAPFKVKKCIPPFKFGDSKERVQAKLQKGLADTSFLHIGGDFYLVMTKANGRYVEFQVGNFEYSDNQLCRVYVIVENNLLDRFEDFLLYRMHVPSPYSNKWVYRYLNNVSVSMYTKYNMVIQAYKLPNHTAFTIEDYPISTDVPIELNAINANEE